MLRYDYEIKLISECEAGSGFGSELVNSLLPRNSDGNIIIPASHIKGLMRSVFEDMGGCLFPDKKEPATNLVFGGGASETGECAESGFRISDAIYVNNETSKKDSFLITRTTIDEFGRAQEHSLRTTEALGAGAVLKGEIIINADKDSLIDIAVRFSMLSIMTIGGNRNRGSGACVIQLAGSELGPGALLKLFLTKLSVESLKSNPIKQNNAIQIKDGDKVVFIKLNFESNGKICCPEIP
ncbi:MAG: RAMP superfamily CRISPR-associated protein, partial [Candidatus Delongbacteria bacterium]|nr:RAMP superfamily CRISPR-associated protein [Candidatus Delongbacteria bacterium]